VRGAAAALLAAIALVGLAGCGSGGDRREPGPASTAATTERVAPPGAPYSFVAPRGFAPAEFPLATLKAGSRFDYVSFYRAAADDGSATVSVMAVDAGEPLAGEPAALAARVWRELGPNAADEPPVTPVALGSQAGFELVADTTTAEASGRTIYRGTAVGRWLVLVLCTSVGDAAADTIAPTCDAVARTVQLSDAPAAPVAGPPAVADGAPYTFTTPEGFTSADPAVIAEQLGGVPGSLVARSWENRVMVFSSDTGHPVAAIDTAAFCRVVEKILPRSTSRPGDGRTIAGRPAVRCGAAAFTDTAGRPVPGLEVDAYGLVHDTHLTVVLCYSTEAQRVAAAKGCEAVLGTLEVTSAKTSVSS
jgi:hypothetical protein